MRILNKRILFTLFAAALPWTGVAAEPSSNVAWTVDAKRLVRAGDVQEGAKIETVETEDSLACTGCHGKAGAEPDRDKHPMLAGQMATYTYKQLIDYKDGKRKDNKMRKAVEPLDYEQLAALAQWYAAQPIPSPEVDPEEQVSEETVRLVFRGDKTRLIQPCASCHGPRGEGAIMDVPALAGQNVKYFVETMKDYAKGNRKNDIYGKMRLIAERLTREEIDELAVYYARLGSETNLAQTP